MSTRLHRALALGALTASMLTLLPSCRSAAPIVRTEIIEVPVEVMRPIPPALTKAEPAPPRPPNNCTDVAGKRTICNRDLVTWLNAYDAALERINSRMRGILGLQPKGDE